MTDNINNLLDAFRNQYHELETRVRSTLSNPTDSIVLERLSDRVHYFGEALEQHLYVFQAREDELATLQTNLVSMQNNIRLHHSHSVDEEHHGTPSVVTVEHTGQRGRPRIHLDPDFLRFASQHRTTAGLARYLNVGVSTVRSRLLEHGLALPGQNPFPNIAPEQNPAADDQHSSRLRIPTQLSSRLSTISDEDLDAFLIACRATFPVAGISMLDGMLRTAGHHVQRRRIRESLLRFDPVQRVFDRIRIQRRTYSVAGPNSLWHHDGQHGLIRWGIVIHGFIDGYSRLITGLRASNNNRGDTVLDLFLQATARYRVPSRLRGDHGVENISVAAWMEDFRGHRRGSYIWGRSVHNVRIERLWVDVTAQIGSVWANIFTQLELHHGLDINNRQHIWLLHHLFLDALNSDLTFFSETWNNHRISRRGEPLRSPIDLFGFDMLVHGVRGDELVQEAEEIAEEDLELYGVDWEELADDEVLQSYEDNNQSDPTAATEAFRTPQHLNEVPLESPDCPFSAAQISWINDNIRPYNISTNRGIIPQVWTNGLLYARMLEPDLF